MYEYRVSKEIEDVALSYCASSNSLFQIACTCDCAGLGGQTCCFQKQCVLQVNFVFAVLASIFGAMRQVPLV